MTFRAPPCIYKKDVLNVCLSFEQAPWQSEVCFQDRHRDKVTVTAKTGELLDLQKNRVADNTRSRGDTSQPPALAALQLALTYLFVWDQNEPQRRITILLQPDSSFLHEYKTVRISERCLISLSKKGFALDPFLLCCLLTYLFTCLLTPRSTVLLEKLTGFQPVKKFPAFYGTRRFITAFTSARHLSLSWASYAVYIYLLWFLENVLHNL